MARKRTPIIPRIPSPNFSSEDTQILLLGVSADDRGYEKYWGALFARGLYYAFWKRHDFDWTFQPTSLSSLEGRWAKDKNERYKKLTKAARAKLFNEIDTSYVIATLTDGLHRRGQKFPSPTVSSLP